MFHLNLTGAVHSLPVAKRFCIRDSLFTLMESILILLSELFIVSGSLKTKAGQWRSSDMDHLRWLMQYRVIDEGSWRGKAVLDLGCGSGYICAEAAQLGANHVVGVDILKPENEAKSWTFLSVDLESSSWHNSIPQPLSSEGFDLICAFDILEHLSSPVYFLQNCTKLLKQGGSIVLTTPNTSSWERFLRPRSWSGSRDPQHKVLFNTYSLQFLLERLGLTSEVMRAPVRKLEMLRIKHPQIGAQIFCQAKKK